MLVAIKVAAPRANVLFSTSQAIFATKLPHINAIKNETLRKLNQSALQNQSVVAGANTPQLVSIARNISFRQCRSHQTFKNLPAAYSISIDASYAEGAEYIYQPSSNNANLETNSDVTPLKESIKQEEQVQESRTKYYNQCFEQATTISTTQRPLVVVMSWLEAKEKHIEKYRQYWLERGYDVLNVKTSPMDLLLPSRGAKKISSDFVKFLLDKQYKHIILHGFSVGGYQFGEFLVQLDNHEQEIRDQVKSSIKGIVFDSLVPLEGTCIGVANSITLNPILSKIIERFLNLYLYVCRNIATKHYLKASEKVWAGPLRCPTLFIVSEDDPISDITIVKRLAEVWKNFGVDTEMKIFKSSPHVQHFIKHKKQYVSAVDEFLEKVEASSDTNRESKPPGA